MTLATRLPWTHPFSGGYPRLGGQPLPTDPIVIDYLERVAAADGAAVEVGVAMAVDAFVKGCKADGIWSAIKASCIMAGARTISGALVPLVGDAPTPYNFTGSDYSRTTGLKGDGSTTYLDTNTNANAYADDDYHHSVYMSTGNPANAIPFGMTTATSYSQFYTTGAGSLSAYTLGNSQIVGTAATTGFLALGRDSLTAFDWRAGGSGGTKTQTATQTLAGIPYYVFGRNNDGVLDSQTSSRLAFYSIGSALDLAALDARVSTLIAAIAAALA